MVHSVQGTDPDTICKGKTTIISAASVCKQTPPIKEVITFVTNEPRYFLRA